MTRRRRRRLNRLSGPMALLCLFISACGDETSTAQDHPWGTADTDQLTDGCAQAKNPIAIPGQDAPPVHMMGGGPVAFPVTTERPTRKDLAVMKVPREIAHLPAAGVELETAKVNGWGPGYGSVFYSGDDPNGLTAAEFMDTGGVRLQITPAQAYWSYDELRQVLGDRLLTVQVGGAEGRLLWADADPSRERYYSVYWIDKRAAYWLAERSGPAQALNAAREVACASR